MKRFILPIKMFAAFRAGAALGLFALCLLCSVFWNSEASAERIKDLASIQGVRDATLEQIAALPGWSAQAAERLVAALKQSDPTAPLPPPDAIIQTPGAIVPPDEPPPLSIDPTSE